MKKIPNWIIIVVVIALLIAAKFMFLGKETQPQGGGGKGKPSAPIAVNYFVASSFTFSNNVYATGKIGALNQIELKPEASGKIIAIYFKEGETVNKGDIIAKMNDAEIQAQLNKNKIQVKLAEEKLERLKKLLAISGVSKEEFDIQENEVASLKADASFMNAQMQKTIINAPFSGSIGLKNISEGAYVSPQESIASLVQLKPLFIEFSVPEKYSSLIKKGMNIKFSLGNSSAKSYTAAVYAIEPKIDETTKTLRARAMYTGNETFYPGTFVKVFADLGSEGKSIMIPTQCVIPVLKGQKVYVCRNSQMQEVKVITGIRTDDKIQILEGLSEGDTVLTTGLMNVKKDSKLKLLRQEN